MGATDPAAASVIIVVSSLVGLAFAAFRTWQVTKITLDTMPSEAANVGLAGSQRSGQDAINEIAKITQAISNGAISFLKTEYKYCAIFMVLYGVIVLVFLGASTSEWGHALASTVAFLLGCATSILSGYVGMKIAVYANGRVSKEAITGYTPAFSAAFKAGSVMGFALCSFGILVLFITILVFAAIFDDDFKAREAMYESIAGYGLGGSSVALFGRVGGGIYTKAADVGADLVGKVEKNIPEDDIRNPAVIADNVGDNVGDIAGMGADLFGSFAESTCAAMVISSSIPPHATNWNFMCFPILISAMGIWVCLITSFFATNIFPVKEQKNIEPTLKHQLLISTVIMTPVVFGLAEGFLPEGDLHVGGTGTRVAVAGSVVAGLWAGLIIGYVTEYFTSHQYPPVRDVANSCNTGAATNIIYGLALGYKSAIIPVIALAGAIYASIQLAGFYGVACAALGMLSTLATGLTIDAYGPISDNAGGIAEMAGLGEEVRERTDALDAAGNTTAAIGKGFAIGSAALVSLALFSAFVTRSFALGTHASISILDSLPFAGLLIGSMLPYAFSAMTMKSVGKAALAMVEEVRNQFKNIPGIMEYKNPPDYDRCVQISTQASLREMVGPAVLVLGTPLFVGFFFGKEMLAGLLAGGLVSGVQMAISSSNTGGAWDNAKKFVEQGNHGGKGSEAHAAAVIGDTVGDPLKDTSGPALNILMKLMAINSLVFAPFIMNYGNLLPGLANGTYPPKDHQ